MCCLVYLNNIIIFNNDTRNKHRALVRKIIKKLADARLQLDYNKFEFEIKKTRYLRFIIKTNQGIAVDLEKIRALLE